MELGTLSRSMIFVDFKDLNVRKDFVDEVSFFFFFDTNESTNLIIEVSLGCREMPLFW
jgi:hypothetical protein